MKPPIIKSRIKTPPFGDFPGGTVDKNLPANAGDTGLIALVQEDSSCHRATKLKHYNY